MDIVAAKTITISSYVMKGRALVPERKSRNDTLVMALERTSNDFNTRRA